MMVNEIYHGDCLWLMKDIPDGSIDAIITDPPYGTTACKWDSVIPFDLMWEQLNRIIKPNGAIVLFGSEPFSSALRMSNIKNFKYDWVWIKNRGSNFGLIKYQPFKEHELICVFNKHNYYPIKQKRNGGGLERVKHPIKYDNNSEHNYISNKKVTINTLDELRYPSSCQKFNTEVGLHPTQKPIALMEYLIKTYTKENETVLDFTIGSGTTAIACINTKRNFIGIELDKGYFDIATKRIKDHKAQIQLF